ncbi:MAG: tetratricopeptide repeat protein [Bacteroidota bacterium]
MKKILILFLLPLVLLFLGSNAHPVNKNAEHSPAIDSLLNLVQTTKEDTTKVNALNSLSRQFAMSASFELALEYAQKAKAKSEKIFYKKGVATAYNNIGIIDMNQGNYDAAFDNYSIALKIYKEIDFKKGIANCYNNLGLIFYNKGDYGKSLDNALKALKMREEIKDKVGVGMSYSNIGNIYLSQGNSTKALEFYFKSLKLNKESGNRPAESISLNNIGLLYGDMKENEKALDYHFKALKINRELGDQKAIAMSHNNLGLVYSHLGNYGDALENQLLSIEINKKIGNTLGLAVSYSNIGNVYTEMRKFEDALHFNYEALNLCRKIGYKAGVKDVYFSLADLFEKKEDYKQALEYHVLFTNLKDTLINEESNKQMADMNTKYGSEKKDKEIQLLNKDKEKQASLAAAELWKQQVILFSVSMFLLLVLAFAIVIYRSFRQKKRLNEELEKLSIVASETDNGVLICGPNGEIEWSNAGLTRLLGYTFEEMKQRGDTIEELSSNPDIKRIIHQSIENKKTSTYQVLNITKDGKERWTQSTLTPIIDDSGNIKKLVVIDTDISERKKIEDKLNEQNKELEQSHKNISILREIGQEITSSLSVETIIEKTYGSINKLMDADVFCIGIYNKLNNSIDFPGFLEKGKKYNSSYNLDDDNRLPVLCFKNHQEILINDLQKEFSKYIPFIPSPIAGEHPESLIYLPLFFNEKVVGVINVESFQKNAYTIYDLNILKNLAVYVAIAIENAKLYENLEEKVEERTAELVKKNEEIEKTYNNIQVLSEIGQEITSTLNLEKVLDTVYEKVNSLMDATEFGIGIYNHQNRSIDFSYYYYESKRMDSDLDTWVSMDDKNRLSVWCVENKKTVFINDMQNEYSKYISNLDSYIGEGKLLLESVICLPLAIEEKLVGLISVQSPRKNTYTQNHLEILQTLASYVAIALDNARLYDNMEGEIKLRTAEIEKQKQLLEEKNLKITDSINYALRIQQAILPSQNMINAILPDSFVFFRPKDIVSGDFYWAYPIDEDQILLAVVDCTGHGVPGAFMSIMGYNLLEQIVKENKIFQPALILDELSKLVVNSLKQTDEVGSIKEGMDIALCKINYKNYELEYAGAHNSLNLIRNGIITETKATNRAIGISLANSAPFINHKIKLEKGDCFYIFSDGYADQKGGPKNEKFFYQPFRQVLLDIHHHSMEKQEQKLERVIYDWKGEREQIDDMLVIGVRV